MQDGVAENFTAGMLDPYLDGCGCATANAGLSFVDPDALRGYVTELDAHGFQVHFHALGDRAVREALDALEAARAANGPTDGRHHLAHLQVVHPDDIPRFAQLGAVANIQPLWAAHEPQMDELTIPFLGPDRSVAAVPLRRPPAVRGPDGGRQRLVGLQPQPAGGHPRRRQPGRPGSRRGRGRAAVRRTTGSPSPRRSRRTPPGSAYVNHHEESTGRIEVGRLADLAVLDRDPFAAPSDEIADTTVVVDVRRWRARLLPQLTAHCPSPGGTSHDRSLPRAAAGPRRCRSPRPPCWSPPAAARPTRRRPARRPRGAPTGVDAPPRPRSGDIDSFTWSLYAEPLSLAYPYAFDYPPNTILSNVCESLLRWNADLSISPGLASAVDQPRRPPRGSTRSATA